jgi:hypothetical protein
MSTKVSIPSNYTFTVRHGSTGGTILVDADLDNIRVKELPRINVDMAADTRVAVTQMPRIEFALKELPRIEFAMKEMPQINFALKEIPSVRAHVPAHFDLGLSIFGLEVLRWSLCGESQVITEKYVPRRAERCD